MHLVLCQHKDAVRQAHSEASTQSDTNAMRKMVRTMKGISMRETIIEVLRSFDLTTTTPTTSDDERVSEYTFSASGV